jgi:hypothetical protein
VDNHSALLLGNAHHRAFERVGKLVADRTEVVGFGVIVDKASEPLVRGLSLNVRAADVSEDGAPIRPRHDLRRLVDRHHPVAARRAEVPVGREEDALGHEVDHEQGHASDSTEVAGYSGVRG